MITDSRIHEPRVSSQRRNLCNTVNFRETSRGSNEPVPQFVILGKQIVVILLDFVHLGLPTA